MRHYITLLFLLALTLPTAAAPKVSLVTMGPGEDPFSAFGHAALCVEEGERTACFNYGTTDFTRPVGLTWDVLRGRAVFWVSAVSKARLLKVYAQFDRTVYVQPLPLSEVAALELAHALATDALPDNRTYVYHHFKENCSTRPRDHVDTATGGALSRDAQAPLGPSWRDLVQDGFKSNLLLLTGGELLLGRWLDEHPTVWEGMFLPDILRREVTARLGVEPITVYERKGPPQQGDRRAGLLTLALVAGAFVLVGALAHRRGEAAQRRVTRLVLSLLGAVGALMWTVAVLTSLPELWKNEALLLYLPTDLVALRLSAPRRRIYLELRLAVVAAALALSVTGLFGQALLIPSLPVVAGLVVVWVWDRRRA